MATKGKVPEYTKRAIEKYHSKFDRFTCYLPSGIKDEIKQYTDKSLNKLVNELLAAELERLKAEASNKTE